MTTFKWPDWRKPSGFPPGQPYAGFLAEQRRKAKKLDHDLREAKRRHQKS